MEQQHVQQSAQDHQQQKDFFSTLFASDVSAAENLQRGSEQAFGPIPTSTHSSMNIPNVPLNFDFLASMVPMSNPPSATPHGQISPQLMLEQRLKLNQLQQLQLQNQILQQQLEFLNGQGGSGSTPMDTSSDRQKAHSHYLGLPTPMNSTELHAQPSPNTEFISPMTLSFVDPSQYRPDMQHQLPPPDMHVASHHMSVNAHATHSAPANIVFNTNPPVPLPSPGELDMDLSPITSPWMEAYQPDPSRQGAGNKRNASPNEDEHARYGRPRPSPAIVPTQPSQSSKRPSRGTKSASSTPLIRSTRAGSRKNSTAGDVPGDTPSPVDLSMPPPAPPASQSDFNAAASSHGASGSFTPGNSSLSNDTPAIQSMTPVTPASIMNLGRLGINSSLAPPAREQPPIKGDGKGKGVSRRESTAKKSSGTSLISPSLKPILPAGSVPNANTMASSSLPSPLMRKTSHKAAEQKRRDSLKTTFDDLRMLLPPIPLPSEDGFPDEPILPGAMPPRGPPRGNVDGPNRGISKLQLLRCGNDFVRQLKGQVERRDAELSTLRREIVRLRGMLSEDAWRQGGEEVELDRDLDYGMVGPWRKNGSAYDGDEGDEDAGE